MDESIYDIIVRYRDYYGSYHHHKEQMAYAATVLYLGAATGVIVGGPATLGSGTQKVLMAVLYVVGAFTAFAFVIWQLRKRRFAADMVLACTSMLAKQVAGELANPCLARRRYRDLELPQFLVAELTAIEQSRRLFRAAGASEVITYIVMGVWTLIAGLRLWL